MKGDLLQAYNVLSALAQREPTLNGINASVSTALTALNTARQEALNLGQSQNQAGYEASEKRTFAAAVPALVAAWRALDRAVALGVEDTNAMTLVDNNRKQRHFAAEQIMDLARNYGNDRRRADDAKRHFQWVIDLLDEGDPLRTEAAAAMKRLGG
jgi:hypothetical protein